MSRVSGSLFSKWIPGLTPDLPLLEGARIVLEVRFKAVRETYRLATGSGTALVEHVHQLRVATRRGDAALRAFTSCLPDSLFRAAKKVLRRFRRRAGEARDWDIFLEKLGSQTEAGDARRILEGFAIAHRLPAQRKLQAACPDFPLDFDKIRNHTLASLKDPPGPIRTLGGHATLAVGQVLADFDRELTEKDTRYESLHRVRIAGKKLRYAMEIFGDCFPGDFRKTLYPMVEQMQEILGEVNDHHNGLQRFRSLSEEMPRICSPSWVVVAPLVATLMKAHTRAMALGRKRFTAWKRGWHSPKNKSLINLLIRSEKSKKHE